MEPYWSNSTVTIYNGDCLDILRSMPDGSIDAVITDPPYPEINRDYGKLTEAQWHDLMNQVVAECRRLLKPSGSAMFVLQPNMEKIGRMRPWLWQFMAKWTAEWNMVQDAWWWNYGAVPTSTCHQKVGLMRASLKACVWLGEPDCYRDQDAVLWRESDSMKATRLSRRAEDRREYRPSGHSINLASFNATVARRGGVTPLNVLPLTPDGGSGRAGHGAGTPLKLAEWWTKYISPKGGTVLDPFMGAGTMGIAAAQLGRRYVGIEQHEKYCHISAKRIRAAAIKSFDIFDPLCGSVGERI